MSVDKFLEPRKEPGETVEIDVVFFDRELGEDVKYKGWYLKTSSKKFKRMLVETARKRVSEEVSEDEYGDVLLSEMMVESEVNGAKLSKDQTKMLFARYPELADYVDQQASKQLVFIKPQLSGSPGTQIEAGGSTSPSVPVKKQRGSRTTGKSKSQG
jgi:hypothetical protein